MPVKKEIKVELGICIMKIKTKSDQSQGPSPWTKIFVGVFYICYVNLEHTLWYDILLCGKSETVELLSLLRHNFHCTKQRTKDIVLNWALSCLIILKYTLIYGQTKCNEINFISLHRFVRHCCCCCSVNVSYQPWVFRNNPK